MNGMDHSILEEEELDYSVGSYATVNDNSFVEDDDVSHYSNGGDLEGSSWGLCPIVSDLELLTHVEGALNRGEKFNHIAHALCIHRDVLSRHLKAVGWSGVYHSIGMDELKEAIVKYVPLSRGGCNWDMRTVAASLRCSLGLRVPRKLVRDDLYSLQPEHMQRRQVRALFRGQYDILEPMILWHIDCELKYMFAVFLFHCDSSVAICRLLWQFIVVFAFNL